MLWLWLKRSRFGVALFAVGATPSGAGGGRAHPPDPVS